MGIYGLPLVLQLTILTKCRSPRCLEKFVRNRNGYPMLYTDICMTRDDFEQMFDHRLYRTMHRKYMPRVRYPMFMIKSSLNIGSKKR